MKFAFEIIIIRNSHDFPRTPHRRAPELPGTGSRTAPRQTGPGAGLSSIVGIGELTVLFYSFIYIIIFFINIHWILVKRFTIL